MKLVHELASPCAGEGVLTYYRQEIEEILSGLVPDLLSVEAGRRSHGGLSMDRKVT